MTNGIYLVSRHHSCALDIMNLITCGLQPPYQPSSLLVVQYPLFWLQICSVDASFRIVTAVCTMKIQKKQENAFITKVARITIRGLCCMCTNATMALKRISTRKWYTDNLDVTILKTPATPEADPSNAWVREHKASDTIVKMNTLLWCDGHYNHNNIRN